MTQHRLPVPPHTAAVLPSSHAVRDNPDSISLVALIQSIGNTSQKGACLDSRLSSIFVDIHIIGGIKSYGMS